MTDTNNKYPDVIARPSIFSSPELDVGDVLLDSYEDFAHVRDFDSENYTASELRILAQILGAAADELESR